MKSKNPSQHQNSPNWLKYAFTSSAEVSWLTPPTKIFLVLLALLFDFGVACLGSIFFPSRQWEGTDRTRSTASGLEKVMKPKPRLLWRKIFELDESEGRQEAGQQSHKEQLWLLLLISKHKLILRHCLNALQIGLKFFAKRLFCMKEDNPLHVSRILISNKCW